VTADDDLLDLQICHRVLDDARGVDVAGLDDVGDVAMDEELAGLAVADGRFRDSAVGASDPEYLGRLSSSKAL